MSKFKGLGDNMFVEIVLIFVIVFGSRCSQSTNPKDWRTLGDSNLNFFSNDFSTGYTVNTSGCSIPKMMLLDPSIASLVHHPWDIKPCSNKHHPLLKSNQTHIWTITKHFKHYKIVNASSLTCCYRSFHQLPRLPIDDLADEIVYMECIMFQDIIEVSNQFVKVECFYNGAAINEEYFVFIPVTDSTDHRQISSEKKGTKESAFNVIVMGLDSVSRVNAHRVIPNTINLLLELGAVELFGYHAIGDDTLDNIIPILSGMTTKELNLTCWPHTKPTLDSCPFVWERFKYVGYQTALVEDMAKSKIFYSDKYGFREREADYYLHPFIHESEKHELTTRNKKKKRKKRLPSLVINTVQTYLKMRTKTKERERKELKEQRKSKVECLGDKYYFGLLLEYVERLTSILKTSNLFGFFWVSSLTGHLNDPMVMDDEFNRLIWKWYDTGYLNKTILVLLSDKGINHGHIQDTKQGQLEQRLPLALILMPPAFRARYRDAYESLKINSNRLTTPFDLHETLIDLVDLNFIKNSDEVFRKNDKLLYERGISLFIPIESNRTCESAGIDNNWCTCHRKQKVRSQMQIVNNAVMFIIKHLNGLLKHYPQCATLQIESVIEVEEMWPTYKKEVEWREFRFEIRVKPGAAEYEALLRLDHGSWWSFLTQVRRLDTYNEPGHCVADDLIKWYCHCK